MKDDICNLFKSIQEGTIDFFCLNYTFLTLIPKKDECIKPGDYGPISLVNGIIKIFSKVLYNRLSQHMDKLRSASQTAFIKGRQLGDGFLSAAEIISFCKRHQHRGMIMKLNFEKAYDKINWNFLLSLLEARGFGKKWCSWVKMILLDSKVAPIINKWRTYKLDCSKERPQAR